ncbi:MAG TPA: hypothetical protein V6D43_02600 [Candidatus Sericytochromatia bacterium]|jgi:hypothetical protein
MDAQDTDWYEICLISSRLTELFAQTISTNQIAFADWYEVMTAPLENSCAEYESDLITRMLYAVRQGLVKVVDLDEVEI